MSPPYALRAFHEYQKCGKSHYGLGETILSDKSNIQTTWGYYYGWHHNWKFTIEKKIGKIILRCLGVKKKCTMILPNNEKILKLSIHMEYV